jgi:hypothetical protein
MNKLIVSFMVAFVLLSILSAIMDGSNSAVATQLNGSIDDDDVIINVDTVTGFLDTGGIIFIDTEKIEYTGVAAGTQFTGCVRGIEGTVANAHADDTLVYNEDLGIINYALGFNIIRVSDDAGWMALFDIPWRFVTITMPKLMLWDYSFFTGELMIVRYVLMTISIGFYIAFAIQALQVAAGILVR